MLQLFVEKLLDISKLFKPAGWKKLKVKKRWVTSYSTVHPSCPRSHSLHFMHSLDSFSSFLSLHFSLFISFSSIHFLQFILFIFILFIFIVPFISSIRSFFLFDTPKGNIQIKPCRQNVSWSNNSCQDVLVRALKPEGASQNFWGRPQLMGWPNTYVRKEAKGNRSAPQPTRELSPYFDALYIISCPMISTSRKGCMPLYWSIAYG